MEISIRIEYEPINNIYLKSNEKQVLLLSNDEKEISAKKLLDFFNYEKGKKYKLEELGEDISNLDENNRNYIEQIYSMMKEIIEGISNIQ